MMYRLVIQNPSSETVVNNVTEEELSYWVQLLQSCTVGELSVFEMDTNRPANWALNPQAEAA